MAEEKDKIAKLEERLANAAATFKEMKAENENLQARITELEDELTLNGGAAQEVEGLKGRLEKAKEIFATQKAKINELTELNNTHVSRITELEEENDKMKTELKGLDERVYNLEGLIENIKKIVNG